MKSIQIATAALLLTGCFSTGPEPEMRYEMTQQGLTIVYSPPTGWSGVRAYVGKRATNSDILLFYQQTLVAGGTCAAASIIGDNGVLFDRTRVNGTSGNDEMYVAATGEDVPKTPCFGTALDPITTSIKLELWAGGGDDVIQALGVNANLIAKGEAGANLMAVGSASFVGGGSGTNVLITTTADPGSPTTVLQGGVGDGTHCAYVPAFLNGDLGTDQWWGPPGTQVFGMESMTTQSACDFWLAAIDARMDD